MLTSTVGIETFRGLGAPLPHGSTDEVIEAMGLYRVVETHVYADGSDTPIPGKKAIINEETRRVLSVVSNSYRPIQFEEFFRSCLEGLGDSVKFHRAGTFGRNDAKAWVLAELPIPIRVKNDESPIRKYLLLVAGHDGSSSALLKNTALRLACANQIGAALRGPGFEQRVLHTPNASIRLRSIARGLQQIFDGYTQFTELANAMASVRFSDSQMFRVIDEVLPVPDTDGEHSRIHEGRENLMRLFQAGAGVQRGYSWAAANAVSEHFDHWVQARQRPGRDVPKAKLESVWIGRSADGSHISASEGDSRKSAATLSSALREHGVSSWLLPTKVHLDGVSVRHHDDRTLRGCVLMAVLAN
ncbi:MAG: DUF932 domain-containing protein [Myxococcaceae bacterium]